MISSRRHRIYDVADKKDEQQLQGSVECEMNHSEGYQIVDMRNENVCIQV